MRPEYTQAVDAARWGLSFWIMVGLPAILIWGVVLSAAFRRERHSWVAILFATLAATAVFWFSGVVHVRYVQQIKGKHMQTPDEQMDWSADTGVVFAPITLIPMAIIYCGLHLAPAFCVYVVIRLFTGGLAPPAEDEEQAATNASAPPSDNPYASPRTSR